MINDNALELFQNLPKNVTFNLDSKNALPPCLCWFADFGEDFPDPEDVLREHFAASEEEIKALDKEGGTKSILLRYKIVDAPANVADSVPPEEDAVMTRIALAESQCGKNLLYVNQLGPDDIMVAGRIKPDELPMFIEYLAILYDVTGVPEEPPSLLASGQYVFGSDDEPMECDAIFGPWNFTLLHDNTSDGLKAKVASFLAVVNPERMWAAYTGEVDGLPRTTVLELVEAGGKVYDEPYLLFEVEAATER